MAVVWLLTGFWHGAAWNYILWGLYYLALLLLEKLLIGQWLRRLPAPIQWAYTALAFMGGWLLFWIEDLSAMGQYLLALVGAFGATGSSTFWELGAWSFIPVLLMCALASTPIVPWLRARVVAWTIGRPLAKGTFMSDDLPNTRLLSTDSLCDYEGYASDGELSDAPRRRKVAYGVVLLASDIALVAMLLLSIASVASGSFNPFIYFRF